MTPPRPRGLAALALTDPDRARAIQSKGGKAHGRKPFSDVPGLAAKAGSVTKKDRLTDASEHSNKDT